MLPRAGSQGGFNSIQLALLGLGTNTGLNSFDLERKDLWPEYSSALVFLSG